jgi:signal transduction histidine kinase
MVLKVAGLAVQRERVRLARELHDDIAPNVASVGLTLDMLIASSQLDAEQERNLSATRENVSLLVERIRSRVQDLRADRSRSLTDFAHSLVAEVDADGPTVIVDIDERVPPRPAAAAEIRGVLTEAFRNALHHSAATVIRIHGRTDEIDGTVSVEDNGVGFDPDREPQQRFGLVGMRERGTLVNAEVSIDSEPSKGTIVTIAWRNTL